MLTAQQASKRVEAIANEWAEGDAVRVRGFAPVAEVLGVDPVEIRSTAVTVAMDTIRCQDVSPPLDWERLLAFATLMYQLGFYAGVAAGRD